VADVNISQRRPGFSAEMFTRQRNEFRVSTYMSHAGSVKQLQRKFQSHPAKRDDRRLWKAVVGEIRINYRVLQKDTAMKSLLALILLFNFTPVNASQPSSFVVNTHTGFEGAINRVKQAVVNHNFRVVRERDMSVNGIKVHAIWFCNFEMLNKVIRTQKKVGYLLPFRITVVEYNHKISISTENPDNSMKFVKSRLGPICKDITAAYKAILDEVSL